MRRVAGQQCDFTLEDFAGQKGDVREHDQGRVERPHSSIVRAIV
jgi:hypothetical protein